MKILSAAAAFIVLLACSAPRVAPEDYCDQAWRKITKAERITKALESLAKDSERLVKNWAFDGGIHFLNWHQNYSDRYLNSSDMDVAYAYYAAFPGCCDVTLPAYLDPKIVSSNESEDRIYESLKPNPGYWVVDVRVWRKLTRPENPRPTESLTRGFLTVTIR
ncbi:hypothetical protein [Sphingopyxis bauzanensis]|uniref:hypothetical protein n=1 Tax=Sphingopyxis bauzanensis TaxID=651663 RepID=UPI001181A401|nr:hypothetical protein [Sphingopyxis bauzanensis]